MADIAYLILAHHQPAQAATDRLLGSREHGCHYIDWSSPGATLPKILDLSDLDSLIRSSALFARKFDEVRSATLLTQLDDVIRTRG